MDMLFPQAWLAEPDEDEPGKTNRQVQTEMAAGLTHSVSREGLGQISASIPTVTIVTGDEDNLVRPSMSRALKACMPEAELVEWSGTGHGIHIQRRRWFNELVERTVRDGRSKL